MVKENPKRAASSNKIRFSSTPTIVDAEIAVIMEDEGGRQYASYNYRDTPVLASDYYNAARRHLSEFWELGENVDAKSGFSHVSKAIASLYVLRDCQINGMVDDDRPPPVDRKHWDAIQKMAEALRAKYPNPKPAVRTWGKRFYYEDGETKVEHVKEEDVLRAATYCQTCGAREGYRHMKNCPSSQIIEAERAFRS